MLNLEKKFHFVFLFRLLLNFSWAFDKYFFLKKSSFKILLNMFIDQIPATSIKFIKFYPQWFNMLFGEMHKLSERYTIM